MWITRYWRHYYEKRRGRLKHGLADYALGLPLLDSDRSVYAYTHTHVVAYTHTHTHTHARARAHTHTHAHTCTYAWAQPNTHKHTKHTHTHTHNGRPVPSLRNRRLKLDSLFSCLVPPTQGHVGTEAREVEVGQLPPRPSTGQIGALIFPHRYRYCYSICLVGVEGVGQACSRSGGGGGGGGEGGEMRGAIRSMIA